MENIELIMRYHLNVDIKTLCGSEGTIKGRL
jgi:hypothetical protein